MSKTFPKIEAALDKLADIPSPEKSKVGVLFHEAFIWQEASKAAEKELADRWKAIDAAKIIPSKDLLREEILGEKNVKDTECYSCIVKVSLPSQKFSLEDFISALTKKYKLSALELTQIADNCKSEGTASVSRRIVEAA